MHPLEALLGCHFLEVVHKELAEALPLNCGIGCDREDAEASIRCAGSRSRGLCPFCREATQPNAEPSAKLAPEDEPWPHQNTAGQEGHVSAYEPGHGSPRNSAYSIAEQVELAPNPDELMIVRPSELPFIVAAHGFCTQPGQG